MLVKIYYSLWAIAAVAAVMVFATGNFTMLGAVVFGFIAFSLTFMGMISVLPDWAAHPVTPKPAPVEPAVEPTQAFTKAESYPVLKSA